MKVKAFVKVHVSEHLKSIWKIAKERSRMWSYTLRTFFCIKRNLRTNFCFFTSEGDKKVPVTTPDLGVVYNWALRNFFCDDWLGSPILFSRNVRPSPKKKSKTKRFNASAHLHAVIFFKNNGAVLGFLQGLKSYRKIHELNKNRERA